MSILPHPITFGICMVAVAKACSCWICALQFLAKWLVNTCSIGSAIWNFTSASHLLGFWTPICFAYSAFSSLAILFPSSEDSLIESTKSSGATLEFTFKPAWSTSHCCHLLKQLTGTYTPGLNWSARYAFGTTPWQYWFKMIYGNKYNLHSDKQNRNAQTSRHCRRYCMNLLLFVYLFPRYPLEL